MLNLRNLILALMLVEGIFICFGGFLYMYHLLRNVARQRTALFTVLLVIPQGFLKVLASRNVRIVEEAEGDEDEDEEEKAKAQVGRAGKPHAVGAWSFWTCVPHLVPGWIWEICIF